MDFTDQQSQALEALFQKNGVVLAYLFGSRASGRSRATSDADIAVRFGSDIESDEYDNLIIRLSTELPAILKCTDVDIVNLVTANNPVLKHNIVFTGQPIYSADATMKTETELAIVREYEDTKYLRRVQFEYLKQHLADGTFGAVAG